MALSVVCLLLHIIFIILGKAEEITSLPTFVDETTASSGLPGDDDGDEVTTPSSSSAAPPQQYGRERFISLLSSEMNPNQAVDSQEYYRFLDSLSKTGEVRRFKFDRLNEARNRARPKLSAASLEFRKFNYTVDAQQEEFDCDLNLLASCESSLLEKIEMIEDHHVVFPLQSIEDDVPTSQEDILELCRSIDHEFQCLFDYAEKCEHKMTAATFAILKYIITKNNETIMSCRQRERDWLGWDQYVDDEPDHEFEELMLPKSSTPCIHQAEVFACINRTFGADFDPLKTLVHTRSQCDQVLRYERCLKQALFERHPATVMCSLQEKELSVHYLLNVIHFPSTEVDVESGDYVYCKNIADRINKQYSYLDDNEQALDMSSEPNKEEDRAFGMTNMLRFYYNSIPSEKCQRDTVVVNELCYAHFEGRLRNLWNAEDIDGQVLWPQTESDMLCCASAELSSCLSTFVLVYCGLEQYHSFRDQIEYLRLQALPEDCVSKSYGSSACKAVLFA